MKRLLNRLACILFNHDKAFNLHRGYFCLQCGESLNQELEIVFTLKEQHD